MDIVDRLFELVDKKFNEQQEFAALLGVDPTLPSRWRNRKSTSYQRRLPQIAEALGTTTEYLLTGNGPQKRGAVSDSDAISEDDIKAAFFEGADDLTKEEMDALWADARAIWSTCTGHLTASYWPLESTAPDLRSFSLSSAIWAISAYSC